MGANGGAVVGRRKVHIEHLDGGKFVQNGTWRQSGSERTQPGPQAHVQAVGQEDHKDVRLHRSGRLPGGQCIACFRPKLVTNVRPSAHFEFRWEGTREPVVTRLGL